VLLAVISEALKLTVADVTRDGLLIRETKLRKTRLVPCHVAVNDRTADRGGSRCYAFVIPERLVNSGISLSLLPLLTSRQLRRHSYCTVPCPML
jgi:hypothetical protein